MLITGEAGIGKTALAKHICYRQIMEQENTKFYYVFSFDEILSVCRDGQNQIFLFDDFWGSVFKNEYDRIEERKMIDVIKMFSRDKTKKLVLTSRKYILEKVFQEREQSKDCFENKEITIELENFSDEYKTKILFRHLKNSNLKWSVMNEIADRYEEIINHNMYNPRTIVRFFENAECKNYTPYRCVEELLKYLKNPESLINEIFQEQTDASKIILVLLLLIGVKIDIKDLRAVYNDYIDVNSKYARKKDFEISMKQLEKELIKVYQDEDFLYNIPIFVEFKDPSIEEFMYQFLVKNGDEYLYDIIDSTNVLNILMKISGAIEFSLMFNSRPLEGKFGGHKLEIDEKLKNKIVDKIIEDYDKLVFHYAKSAFDNVLCSDFSELDKLEKIIKIYNILGYEKLKLFIESKANLIIDGLENDKRRFWLEDMYHIVPLVKAIKENYFLNAAINPEKVIEGFYNNIKFSEEFLIMEDFESIFPEEYKKFKESNRKEIISNILSTIMDDVDYFLSDALYEKIDELIDDTYPEIFECFNIPYNKSFEKDLYELAEKNTKVSKQELKERKKEFEMYKEKWEQEEKRKAKFFEKEKDLLLGKKWRAFDDEEAKKIIENNTIDKKYMQKLNRIFKRRYYIGNEYIRDLLESRDGLLKLIEAVNTDKITLSEKKFWKDFLNFLVKDYGGKTEKIYLFAFEQLKKGLVTFSINDVDNEYEPLLADLFDLCILKKDGDWISFLSRELQIYLSIKYAVSNNITCTEFIENYMRIFNQEFEECEILVCKMYKMEDEKAFYKTFSKVQTEAFLEMIDSTSDKSICCSMLKYFDIEAEIDNNFKVDGFSMTRDYINDLLEINGIDIADCIFILAQNMDNEKLLRKLKYYNKDGEMYRINMLEAINDDEMFSIFGEIGVCGFLLDTYDKILKMKSRK